MSQACAFTISLSCTFRQADAQESIVMNYLVMTDPTRDIKGEIVDKLFDTETRIAAMGTQDYMYRTQWSSASEHEAQSSDDEEEDPEQVRQADQEMQISGNSDDEVDFNEVPGDANQVVMGWASKAK